MWANDMVAIVPRTNLVFNIGLNEFGTNTLSPASHLQNVVGQYRRSGKVAVPQVRRSKVRDFLELTVFRWFAARQMSGAELRKKLWEILFPFL